MIHEHLWLSLWVGLGCVLLLLQTYWQLRFSRQISFLKDVSIPSEFKFPRVSLIVPACNEAATIENALSTLLQISFPDLEIIVVNDRSQDETGSLIENLKQQYPALQLVQILNLPSGWLGKVHAMEQGRKRATGEWLLFTDADVHYGNESLQKAVVYAIQNRLDLLTVAPAVEAKPFSLKVFIAQFCKVLCWSLNFNSLRSPEHRQAIGIGAFNLVRRSTFESSRGFEWLRLEVIDDAGLATMLKEEGARLDLLGGKNEVSVEWYSDLTSLIRGLEKNTFSVFQFSYGAVIGNLIFMWIVLAGIYLIPFILLDVRIIIFVLGVWGSYLTTGYMALRKMLPFSTSSLMAALFCAPIAEALFPLMALRASILFKLRGGINWRGTVYRKDELVSNQRLKLMNQLFKSRIPKMERP